MHHTLDIHPFPKDVLYINEFELVDVVNTYDSQKKHDKALSGKCKKEGGVLPDDNVRIYVPIDLNADYIINRLRDILASFGSPSENNESALTVEVGKLVAQLEIYDQACTVRNLKNAYRNTPDSDLHCTQGKELAKNFIAVLMENEWTGDSFPYNIVNGVREAFGV